MESVFVAKKHIKTWIFSSATIQINYHKFFKRWYIFIYFSDGFSVVFVVVAVLNCYELNMELMNDFYWFARSVNQT